MYSTYSAQTQQFITYKATRNYQLVIYNAQSAKPWEFETVT